MFLKGGAGLLSRLPLAVSFTSSAAMMQQSRPPIFFGISDHVCQRLKSRHLDHSFPDQLDQFNNQTHQSGPRNKR